MGVISGYIAGYLGRMQKNGNYCLGLGFNVDL